MCIHHRVDVFVNHRDFVGSQRFIFIWAGKAAANTAILLSMSEFFPLLGLDAGSLALIVLSALLVGFSKTGLGGVMMLVVPMLAAAFGGKASTGVLLPMLIVGDFLAVRYYHLHADWPGILRLLPWTILGLLAGIFIGNQIEDRQFTLLIALSVLVCLAVLIVMELKAGKIKVPRGTWFYALIGLMAGFTTMIGNVAGPIFAVYLLAQRYEKKSLLGTSAWFFMLINLTKLPLQIFFWGNITVRTGQITLLIIPAILVGAVLGALVVKRIPEKPFRWLVIGMTAVSALRLFF